MTVTSVQAHLAEMQGDSNPDLWMCFLKSYLWLRLGITLLKWCTILRVALSICKQGWHDLNLWTVEDYYQPSVQSPVETCLPEVKMIHIHRTFLNRKHERTQRHSLARSHIHVPWRSGFLRDSFVFKTTAWLSNTKERTLKPEWKLLQCAVINETNCNSYRI